MIFLLTSCYPVLFLISSRTVCHSHHYQPEFLSTSLSLKLWFLFSAIDSLVRYLDVQTRTELEHPNLAASTLKKPRAPAGTGMVKVEQTSRDTWPDSLSWHIVQHFFFFQKQPQQKSVPRVPLPVARPEQDIIPAKGKAEVSTGIPVLSFGTP